MSTLGTIEGTVIDSTGPIFAMRNGARIELAINDPVYESDIITTGNETTADILYRDGTKSRIAPNTNFTLTDYEFGSNVEPSFVMDLTRGAVRTVTGEIVERNPEAFEVITPRATVGIRGTEFMNSVDSSTNIETHAVLYISEGSIMLVTDAGGNSLSLDAPLQVTQFIGNSATANGVSSFTLGQMQSVLQVIAPTLSTNIPQTDAQQGQWESVQQVLIEQREQEEQEQEARELEAEANRAENEADDAEQAILDNPPTGAVQDNLILISLGDTEDESLEALFEALRDAGFNLAFADDDDDDDYEDYLENLYENAQGALNKPEFSGDDNHLPIEISFTRYEGGNLAGYTPEFLEKSGNSFYLKGFEIHGNDDDFSLKLGSGNDTLFLDATSSSGHVYADVAMSGSYISTSALYNTNIEMGAGNDSLIINQIPSAGAPTPEYAMVEAEINMGSGNDYVNINGGVSGDDLALNMGAGNDFAILGTTGNDNTFGIDVSLGGGNDILVATYATNYDDNIDGGEGGVDILIGSIEYSSSMPEGFEVYLSYVGNDSLTVLQSLTSEEAIENKFKLNIDDNGYIVLDASNGWSGSGTEFSCINGIGNITITVENPNYVNLIP